MSGHSRIKALSGAGIACLSLTLLAGFGPASNVPSASTGWRVVASTRTIAPTAIVVQSRHSAWMLGGGFTLKQPQSDFPAALHWNGRTWSKVGPASFPKAIRSTGIGCAGASSATNVWAFAGSTNSGGFANADGALRLEGGRWKLVKQFPVKQFGAGIVTGCLVESPTEIWVFGDAHVAPGVGTWHLHGRAWKQVTSGSYALDAASALTPDDVWADGETGFFNPVVAHWNGRVWARNTKLSKMLPKASASVELFLGGITAPRHDDVWLRVEVVRNPAGHEIFSAIVLHWNGRVWHRASPTDFGYYLPGAVRDGHGGWWADVFVNRSKRLVLHSVGRRWFKIPDSIRGCTAGQLTQVAPVPGSTSVLGLQNCPAKSAPPVVNVLLRGPRL
jgi:hypothetical protein